MVKSSKAKQTDLIYKILIFYSRGNGGRMDNSVHKHFDFFLCEVEADIAEEEAEQLKTFFTGACSHLDSWQRNIVFERLTPILDKLHETAARNRAEAERRKANIENAADPEIKEILQLFYIKRITLERMADILYCDRTTISRKVKRYCKKYLDKG